MKNKKIIVSIFVFASVLTLGFYNKVNVKAEESCTTHTNYYLFADASKLAGIKELNGAQRTTSKSFNLGVPAEGKIKNQGQIKIVESNNLSDVAGTTSITTKDYFTISRHAKTNGTVGSDKSTSYYCKNDSTNCFATAVYWFENGVESSNSYEWSEAYDDFIKHLDTEFTNAKFGQVAIGAGSENFNASVTRVWPTASINKLESKGLTADDVVYSIAAYYVQYDICDKTEDPDPTPVEKNNKVTTHYFIENTTTKLHDDTIEHNVPKGTYTSSCPETLSKDGIYYDRLQASVSVDMPEEGEEELVCYYKEQTYSMTISYGEDEDCTKLLQDSVYKDGLKAGESMSIDVPNSIDSMTRPTLGTYSSQIVNKPELNGTNLTFVMPAKDVNICIVYTPQTGSSMVKWIALIGLGALAFAVWNISKKNNEINNEV